MEPFTSPATRERLRAVWQESPWLADFVLAALVGVLGAIGRPTLSFATPEQIAYSIIVFGCSIALIFRRMRPRLALAVVGVLLVLHLVAVQELTVFAGAVCLVGAYTTQTQLLPPWRWGYVAAIYIGAGMAVLTSPTPTPDADWMIRLVIAAAAAALITVAVLAGIVRRARKARYEDALERAAVLEARQAVERRLAAVEERARIAREMHDVLGHSLNTIAVQAEGARYVIRTDPDRTDQVLADIGRLSRTAVDDVRDLISVLAADDDTPEAPIRPTPTLRDVGALISDLRYTKATIRLHVDGDLSTVPDQVGLAGYRIIQESLTNVLKHADGAAASVRIRVRDRVVELTIVNTSTGELHSTRDDDPHHGIIGMRERARALGGTLTAGPGPDTGGWRVAAHLPWRRA
ncbi:sensor histidine kinase [Brevibacterium luteolum]|uniref:histidine kinase n=1 Tax=Brevibacterium luteolum TaxID=199591 RepID=A0A6G8KYW4_9MICO|nr:histidine kinase [Brevibacterium luteolum]QIN29846.1 two-component sensor histidine kinase [Brevibacterium luteolum]